MKPVDMSPQAVTRRLQQVDELRDLCVALAGPRLKRPQGEPAPVVKEGGGYYGAHPNDNPTSGNVPNAATNLKTS